MGKKSKRKKVSDTLPPKPPETLQKIKWFLVHGSKHKKIIAIGVLIFILAWFAKNYVVKQTSPISIPLPIPGDIVINTIGMKLVYISPDDFEMGSSDSRKKLVDDYKYPPGKTPDFIDEFPRHKVHISKGFWMGQTEITQGQYKSVMNAQPWSGKKYVQESATNPAVYVSWDDAMEFCRKLSLREDKKMYRLPTEAEWEYACRAGTKTRFSFEGNDSLPRHHAWFDENADDVNQKYAHSVGQLNPNDWDLYDMHGNVWEWCSDYYDPNYYKDNYSNSPIVNPESHAPSSGARRSQRGGSWKSGEINLRCSVRRTGDPTIGDDITGFRVVRSQ